MHYSDYQISFANFLWPLQKSEGCMANQLALQMTVKKCIDFTLTMDLYLFLIQTQKLTQI